MKPRDVGCPVVPSSLSRAMRPLRVRSPIVVERGDIRDYDALASFHYRCGRPATRVLVLRAVDRRSGTLAGVLVISMPTLNGQWRGLAWPARYAGRDRRRCVRRLNREVRTISRVIVDPRYRSRGVASMLVRAYLSRPLTRRTEAVAAMGGVCPFFERAGMREVRTPAREGDRRLLASLRRHGLTLESLSRVGRVRSDLVIELRRWCRSRVGLRGSARRGPRRLAELASLWCGAPLHAYIHEKRCWRGETAW